MSTLIIRHPPVKEVIRLMKALSPQPISQAEVRDAPIHSIGEYVADDGAAAGYISCDLTGGCCLGAALTLVPFGVVKEAVNNGAIPESLSDNLDEIFNVCVNLLTPTDGRRLVLSRTVHGDSSELEELTTQLQDRTIVSYGITIQRYGDCQLSIAL